MFNNKAAVASAVILFCTIVHQSFGQAPYADSYAPAYVRYRPNVQWVRPAHSLSESESEWVDGRKKVVFAALFEYLSPLKIQNYFSLPNYLEHIYASNYADVPVCMTYTSGLSGGGFPTVSLAVNNLPTACEIVQIWKPSTDGIGANETDQSAATYNDMFKELGAKMKAGFNVGTADLYGLIFGYEFTHNLFNTTFSGIVNQTKFRNHEMLMPILQIIELTNLDDEYFGLDTPSAKDTVYDLTPFEFGAWGGSATSFTPTRYMGTRLKNGAPVNESACVLGFDRASYTIGLSATAWNLWASEAFSNGTEGSFSKSKRSIPSPISHLQQREEIVLLSTVTGIDEAFQKALNLNLTDIAYAEVPNPFLRVPSSLAYTQTATDLRFVDGSEGGQTIPLWGLIQPSRNGSFVVAWEDSNDAHPYQWMNGTNLYNTYVAAKAAGLPFPIITPMSNFISHNYTTKPVFFGCGRKLTTTGDSRSPIVLYLANAPYSSYMNYSAAVNVMSPHQINDIFVNSSNLITQGNGTLDEEWPICLACATIERILETAGMQTPPQCKSCFQKYCWDGNEVSRSDKTVDLSLVLDPNLGYDQWLDEHPYWNVSLSHDNAVPL